MSTGNAVRRSLRASFLLGIVLTSDIAMAIGRRARNWGSHSSNQTYAPQTFKMPERPAAIQYDPNPTPRWSVETNYRYMLENPKETAIPLKINVTNKKITSHNGNYFVTANYADLKNSKTVKRVSYDVTRDEANNIYFQIDDLRPEAVYKIHLDFYAGTREKLEEAKHIFKTEAFYGVTSGETELAKARHQITTTALLEHYDWMVGRKYNGPAHYGDCEGGWCGMFPLFCARRHIKVFSESPHYSYRQWGRELSGGAHLLSFMANRSVHGDHGWNGYHKFMVLEHDRDTNLVHTIEGNFGNRVAMSRRTVGEFTLYGAIEPGMLWEEPKSDDEMAQSKTGE